MSSIKKEDANRKIQRISHANVQEGYNYPPCSTRFWLYIGTLFGAAEQESRERNVIGKERGA